MSRIGKRPIKIEEGIKLEITATKVVADSGSIKRELAIPQGIKVKESEGTLIIERENESKETRSLHGLTTRLLQNLLTGVKTGFTKELEFTGTGYRVRVEGSEMILSMGYSHEIKIAIPADVTASIKKNSIVLQGVDKQIVGQLAAKIREVRPPEVYKGKGIKYKDEIIRRKAGKKAA